MTSKSVKKPATIVLSSDVAPQIILKGDPSEEKLSKFINALRQREHRITTQAPDTADKSALARLLQPRAFIDEDNQARLDLHLSLSRFESRFSPGTLTQIWEEWKIDDLERQLYIIIDGKPKTNKVTPLELVELFWKDRRKCNGIDSRYIGDLYVAWKNHLKHHSIDEESLRIPDADLQTLLTAATPGKGGLPVDASSIPGASNRLNGWVSVMTAMINHIPARRWQRYSQFTLALTTTLKSGGKLRGSKHGRDAYISDLQMLDTEPALAVPSDLFKWTNWLFSQLQAKTANLEAWTTPSDEASQSFEPRKKPRTERPTPRPNPTSERSNTRPTNPENPTKPKEHPPATAEHNACYRCGRNNHKTENCFADEKWDVLQRPFLNKSRTTPYAKSTQAKALFELCKAKSCIPGVERIKKYSKEKACKCSESLLYIESINEQTKTQPLNLKTQTPENPNSKTKNQVTNSTLTISLQLLHRKGTRTDVTAFIDPGAQQGSYISPKLFKALVDDGEEVSKCDKTVCGAIKNSCSLTTHSINIQAVIKPNKETNTLQSPITIAFNALVVDIPFDLIVGLPTIREFHLFKTLAPLFEGHSATKLTSSQPPTVSSFDPQPPASIRGLDITVPSPDSDGLYALAERLDVGQGNVNKASDRSNIRYIDGTLYLNDGQPHQHNEFLQDKPKLYTENKDVISTASSPGWLPVAEAEELRNRKLPHLLWGTKQEQETYKALIYDYQDIFSDALKPQPALLTPMQLKVNLDKWHTRGNQQPLRQYTQSKLGAIRKFTQINQSLDVIRLCSEAQAWSHLHPIVKPSDTVLNGHRVTMDCRNLNDCTESTFWPIPKAEDMLDRIGSFRPNYFAMIDLKDGYHQIPLAKDSQKFTAFKTQDGIYCYKRVPQGTKNAGGYFQEKMTMEVFNKSIHHHLEVYFDDIAVHDRGEGFSNFKKYLKQTFDEIRSKRLLISPKKCTIGVPEAVFLGHTIDKEGKHFSTEKLDKVLQVPLPTYAKGLKSFLGLTQWFSAHVHNYSVHAKPLHALITNYTKNRQVKIQWTEETMKSFEYIRLAVNQCPKLFFIQPPNPLIKSRIVLETDASDYAIGAYLYQEFTDQNEQVTQRPIGFMSHALSKTEMGWSTYEKEGYAMYCAVMKWHHLLGDQHFTIKTDHINLTHIKTTGSPKVMRWKSELQQYSFTLEYIEGPVNEVADGFSRLVPVDVNELRAAKGLSPLLPPHTPDQICALWETATHDNKTDIENINFIHENGHEFLYHISEATIPIPDDEYAIIAKVHNDMEGHLGTEQTYAKLTHLGYSWQYMRVHIRQFIRTCAVCQKNSFSKPKVHTMPFTTSARHPMERIAIDTIGPLTTDEDDFKYILVIVDCFTRWIELYPLKSLLAEEAALCIFNFFGRYGFAEELLTDNGLQLSNKIVDELVALLGGRRLTSTPYSKEENGIVERHNLEVMRHLRNIIADRNSQVQWGKRLLPLVQRIMNASVRKSTGVSPAQLLFGDATTLERAVFVDPIAVTHTSNKTPRKALLGPKHFDPDSGRVLSELGQKLIRNQRELLALARKHQEETDLFHIAQRAPQAPITEFPIGSYVLMEYAANNLRRGHPEGKLKPIKHGPLRVVGRDGLNYTLENLVTGHITHDVSVHLLHQYDFDPLRQNPVEAAMMDEHEEIVEEVLSHRNNGKGRGKTNLEFLVKWKNYDPTHNEWLPWKTLRPVEALHIYLSKTHGLRKYVPKTHGPRIPLTIPQPIPQPLPQPDSPINSPKKQRRTIPPEPTNLRRSNRNKN